MYPILLRLGPLTLHTYGLFIALGLLATLCVATWLRRREGAPTEHLQNLALWMIVSGVFFSRVAYVVEHWSEFAEQPFYAVLRIDQGGLMFYGGFLGAIVALLVYARARRESFLGLSDLICTVLPLGHALGRIGCFFFGCCHGRLADSAFGVSFPRNSPAWVLQVGEGLIPETATKSLPVLPTQLFEAGANLLVFLLLLFLYRRGNRRDGFIAGLYVMLYAVMRFLLEYTRGDERYTTFLSLSISQTIAAGLFLLGAGVAGFALCHKKKQVAEAGG